MLNKFKKKQEEQQLVFHEKEQYILYEIMSVTVYFAEMIFLLIYSYIINAVNVYLRLRVIT